MRPSPAHGPPAGHGPRRPARLETPGAEGAPDRIEIEVLGGAGGLSVAGRPRSS